MSEHTAIREARVIKVIAALAIQDMSIRPQVMPMLRRAAIRVDDRTLQDLARKTDRNDHNGALLLLAQILGAKRETKFMQHIIDIAKEVGHNPLTNFRYRYVHEPLMKMAKAKLDPAIYDQIHGAF